MGSMTDLAPGDLMFSTIAGIGGKLIAWGEKINDPDVTWEVAREIQHVGVISQSWPTLKLVQAMPDGAEEVPVSADYWTDEQIYVRVAVPVEWMARLDIADEARRFIGVPYSFLDYAALAGRHILRKTPRDRTWLDRYVSSTKRMICSQLADQAMCNAGFHVFDDGRIPQDVTPAALYAKLISMQGTRILRPLSMTGWEWPAR